VLVGSGRAGKTSTAKSILGESFQNTASTLGMEIKNCTIRAFDSQVLHAKVGGGRTWSDLKSKPNKELGNAILTFVAFQKQDTQPISTDNASSKVDTSSQTFSSTSIHVKQVIPKSKESIDEAIQSNALKTTSIY